jgi:hypothetical protein
MQALDAAALEQLSAEIDVPALQRLHAAIGDRLARAGVVGGLALAKLTVDELRFLRDLSKKYSPTEDRGPWNG